MSHGRERKEKDCLNCGAIVQGRYCQVCGQENRVPHETFWGMVNHFFSDITHFDGKFFSTVGILFRKPGYLSKMYLSGKRDSFLNPVRMYVFTSALFFLVFFSFYKFHLGNIEDSKPFWKPQQRAAFRKEAYKNAKTAADSAEIDKAMAFFNPEDSVKSDTVRLGKTDDDNYNMVLADDGGYKTLHEYDSVQAGRPPEKRDGWLKRMVRRKGLDLNERYPNDQNKLTEEIVNKFVHNFPYLLFISLPLYAFFLYLLYVRRRFFFADHGVFLIHLYIFTFLVLLSWFLLEQVDWEWLFWVQLGLFVYGFFYTVLAFKKFYGQGWGKTIFKFLIFNLICLVSLLLLFTIFFGYALYQV